MTDPLALPLLFLDVDGPLIPFGGPPDPRWAAAAPDDANPLLVRLDPGHGARLAALPCELVWATTWLADANACVAPRIGLPELPVVSWPEPSLEEEREDARLGLHWKTRTLVAWAAGRPFTWVDDELSAADRSWVDGHQRAATLLHRVDPRCGLTDADFAALDTWLRGPAREPRPLTG
ncbi:HAD domain-containing protein [Kitasatospora nipponensis]|uniref:HAD domain-containing protein n=1 Tax=Kitasatospora nipponensis TaxID=258049 RepID=A0ABN1X2G5_9ACTN